MGRSKGPDPEHLRSELIELVKSADSSQLRRAHLAICKPPRHRSCRVKAPRPAWMPKHVLETRKALELIKNGVGVRTAPYSVSMIDGAWQHKFFCWDISQMLIHSTDGPASDLNKAGMSKHALVVASLASHIVEEARLLEGEAVSPNAVRIKIQKANEDPGWDRVKTRGSGIVFNDPGRALFEEAAARVAARLDGPIEG